MSSSESTGTSDDCDSRFDRTELDGDGRSRIICEAFSCAAAAAAAALLSSCSFFIISDTTGVGTLLLNVDDRLAAADAAAATVDEGVVADTGVAGTVDVVLAGRESELGVLVDSPLLLWLTGGR